MGSVEPQYYADLLCYIQLPCKPNTEPYVTADDLCNELFDPALPHKPTAASLPCPGAAPAGLSSPSSVDKDVVEEALDPRRGDLGGLGGRAVRLVRRLPSAPEGREDEVEGAGEGDIDRSKNVAAGVKVMGGVEASGVQVKAEKRGGC